MESDKDLKLECDELLEELRRVTTLWEEIRRLLLLKMKYDLEKVCTNADNIRIMSDEELVRVISGGAIMAYCHEESPIECKRNGTGNMSACEVCAYEWLKKPAQPPHG